MKATSPFLKKLRCWNWFICLLNVAKFSVVQRYYRFVVLKLPLHSGLSVASGFVVRIECNWNRRHFDDIENIEKFVSLKNISESRGLFIVTENSQLVDAPGHRGIYSSLSSAIYGFTCILGTCIYIVFVTFYWCIYFFITTIIYGRCIQMSPSVDNKVLLHCWICRQSCSWSRITNRSST